MKRKEYTFQNHLRKSLKNPKFRKIWEDSEPQRKLSQMLIEKRIAKKMSQRALASKANTTQAVIARIEGMSANPSINLLKRIASAFGSSLRVVFE